jgi:hypothetical protein
MELFIFVEESCNEGFVKIQRRGRIITSLRSRVIITCDLDVVIDLGDGTMQVMDCNVSFLLYWLIDTCSCMKRLIAELLFA